jgi:Tfp pilus assembly protein PilW
MKPMQRYQSGASMMEVLVAMSISLVVTAAMIALMSNSLGTTARIVKMTKLADDLRITMQMMTRDLRRSSYNASSVYCYGNDACAFPENALDTKTVDETLGFVLAGSVDYTDQDNDGVPDCFTFRMDRDHDGNATENDAGGFRRVVDDATGFNVIEMWTGDAAGSCADAAGAAGWVQITDPEVVEVTDFSIDDTRSYTEVIQTDGAGVPTRSLLVRKVEVTLEARLILDPQIQRQIVDVISVRNDVLVDNTAS